MTSPTITHEVHRCMRCGEEFQCIHDGDPTRCTANYDVLPSLVRLVDGRPVVEDHCPDSPTWEYVRARVERERDSAAQALGLRVWWDALTPEQRQRATLGDAFGIIARSIKAARPSGSEARND